MTPQETSLLVGAIIGLIGAVQAWLVARTVQHGKQLNGELDTRMAKTAKSIVANDHTLRSEPPSPAANPATMARIGELEAELATLRGLPTAGAPGPQTPSKA